MGWVCSKQLIKRVEISWKHLIWTYTLLKLQQKMERKKLSAVYVFISIGSMTLFWRFRRLSRAALFSTGDITATWAYSIEIYKYTLSHERIRKASSPENPLTVHTSSYFLIGIVKFGKPKLYWSIRSYHCRSCFICKYYKYLLFFLTKPWI